LLKKRPIGRKQAKDKGKKFGNIDIESLQAIINVRKEMAEKKNLARSKKMEENHAADERRTTMEERKTATQKMLAAMEDRKVAIEERKVAMDEMLHMMEQKNTSWTQATLMIRKRSTSTFIVNKC
jgi:hypothetical protein